MCRDELNSFSDLEMILNRTKSKGLNSVLQIGFGDNHGDVCGGDVGTVMDYEGRHIRINKDDFVVITEKIDKGE